MDQRLALSSSIRCGCLQGRYECHYLRNEPLTILRRSMPLIIFAFLKFSGPTIWMSAAGLALLVIGLLAAKNDIARARGLDRIVALTNLCFATPLAMFGAEHFSLGSAMIGLV